MTLFKCDYYNCNRVLHKDEEKSFPCTSCGHGTMKIIKPKAYCAVMECRAPIYENIDPGRDIICSDCTRRMLSDPEVARKVNAIPKKKGVKKRIAQIHVPPSDRSLGSMLESHQTL